MNGIQVFTSFTFLVLLVFRLRGHKRASLSFFRVFHFDETRTPTGRSLLKNHPQLRIRFISQPTGRRGELEGIRVPRPYEREPIRNELFCECRFGGGQRRECPSSVESGMGPSE